MLKSKIKVIAVASAGGHWEQLMLMRPTLEQYDAHYVSTDRLLTETGCMARVEIIPDCSKDTPLNLARCAVAAARLIFRHRPQVVITGAAPGFFCILAGRLVGARTLWIDSVANGEQLSTGDKLARAFANNCWTQWEHLARGKSLRYRGALL
jgi:hypothetical protein